MAFTSYSHENMGEWGRLGNWRELETRNHGWRRILSEVPIWRDIGNQKPCSWLKEKAPWEVGRNHRKKDNRALKPAWSPKSCFAHFLKMWLGQAALNATPGQWHWLNRAFGTCSPPVFVTLAKMCQWVAYSNVSARAVHDSPASVTPGAVKTRMPGSPPDLLYHSVWKWVTESAF